ncbi:capsular polysaccharide biosynthesis protein [Halomonas sp. EGI 63088]|uniref:Capsular polysaccharide biosynthesis protein n=1 Tax=Halomonas flagellata TaxID=2920385 RepID=A0ABS9RXW0_9GAMM|nr:capsular polysaccharide biosynthesis protein [Halomonas flagellata]MCH4564693.1 capsular polysaccharide biosynthesis protein [Halomonas flagellata]
MGLPFAACASRGICRLSILPACLSEYQGFTPLKPWQRPDVTLGWGLKPTSLKARQLAGQRGIPYVSLEDGFLRSWGLGVNGYQPHSLIVDTTGIYYDATRPSDLEQLILDAPFSGDELKRADHCMALIRHYRLSKYNHAPDRSLPVSQKKRVLVVDQTAGDASIHYGLADTERFRSMLQVALDEHPEAEILVKVHPDVVAGRKQGHLLDAARQHPRCRLIAEDLNPWCLFDTVEAVHVVTSQLGFEALLAGKPVTCHGMPFYAGWGLTEDRTHCARRHQPRSLLQLFAAAYLRYARYANPYTGQASSLEATIDLIADQTRRQAQLAGDWLGMGFSSWKRGFVGDFLGEQAKLRHASRPARAQPAHSERLLLWSSQQETFEGLPDSARTAPLWRMEDGFIRSIGLGVDLVKPLSLALDSRGIHYDPRQPSDLEHLLATQTFSPHLLERARGLRERLVDSGLSKYNVGTSRAPQPQRPGDRRSLLVVGQVESDASVRFGSPHVTTNGELLRRVRAAAPDARVIYKPHPDVVSGARLGRLEADTEPLYDEQITDVSITDLLPQVAELHTMSSLAGFEALLRGCHVVTYGLPFYAGWGLTEERGPACPRRQRQLSLDELVAGCLILYPLYVDPRSRQLVNAETVVDWLERHREQRSRLPLSRRLYRWYRNSFIGRH